LVAFFSNKKVTQIQLSGRVLACIISVLVIGILQAQQYPFVYYTPKDGLINSRVKNIIQDSKGRMYFMTYGGLSVYDGVRFTNYNQQSGLANELVNDIVEITPDSFLIATNAPVLNTLVRGKIGVFHTKDNISPVINHFLLSKEGDWYVSADGGLFLLKSDRFVRLPTIDKEGFDIGQNLDKMIEWNEFLIILPWDPTRKDNLIVYNKREQKISSVLTHNSILSMAFSPKKEIWISTGDGIKMADESNLSNGKIILLPLPSVYNASHHKNYNIFFDQNLNTWLYNNNEIIKIPDQGQEQIISAQEGLKISGLVNLFVDREGTTWMASDGNGVVKLVGTNVQVLDHLLPGIPNNFSSIHQQGDTTWLYNIPDHSIYRLHDQIVQSFRIYGESVQVGNIYTPDQSLYFKKISNVYYTLHRNQPSSYKHPGKMFADSIKIVEVGNGVIDHHEALIQNIKENDTTFFLTVWYDHKMQMFYPLPYSSDQIGMDKEGKIWAPTRNNHLLVFTVHPEQPSQYLQLIKDFSREIQEMNPRSITIDNLGNVWIGSRYKGLYCLHFKEMEIESVEHFTTQEGLTDNFIYRLYCDPQQNIWACTQTGLDKIYLKKDHYVIENVSKSKNIFKTIYQIINKNDKMIWALAADGTILQVSENMPNNLPSAPPLLLTSLAINGIESDSRATIFRYNENNFSIRVAAPSFKDEKSILYSYYLKGSGINNWSDPSNNAQFNFINLDPGTYELNVKADFPALLYPPQTFIYAFTIKPPYWRTWWFRILTGSFIVILLAMAIRYYYAKKLEKQRLILESKQAMEKERTRIATDMHDDLGAGLTRIKFLSETIGIKKQLHLPVEEEIQNIRSYAHEMIDKMGEIVWALNEKNDSLSDLISYTRSYAVQYLSENGLKSVVNTPDDFSDMPVSGEFRRNIFLSVKEALHNIIKHAQANEVIIRFEISSDLVIHIIDDGIGYDPNNIRPYSNGLLNMNKRMTDIGGKMEIMSGHGTTIRFSVPLTS